MSVSEWRSCFRTVSVFFALPPSVRHARSPNMSAERDRRPMILAPSSIEGGVQFHCIWLGVGGRNILYEGKSVLPRNIVG